MDKSIKLIIRIIIFLGKYTFLGRGILKRFLIKIIEFLTFKLGNDLNKPLFKTKIYDFFINFYSDKKTEMKIYFQRKENKELNYIKKVIGRNTWFIDIGSNIGLYSLNVASLNDKTNKINILSIEPHPIMLTRLKENLDMLIGQNIYVKKRFFIVGKAIGVNKKNGYLDISGNHANSRLTLDKKKESIKVKIVDINDLIKKYKIKKIGCIKIDTEGSEFQILKSLFKKKKNNKILLPLFMIIEHNREKSYYHLHNFIISRGYNVVFKSNSNYVYKKSNKLNEKSKNI